MCFYCKNNVSEKWHPTLPPGTSLISQRKIAVSFRHNALLNIFQISLQALQSLQADPASEARLKEQATTLVLVCLSYDFVGRVGYDFSLAIFCSQNTVQLTTASQYGSRYQSDTQE